jgi:hypothetical protein
MPKRKLYQNIPARQAGGTFSSFHRYKKLKRSNKFVKIEGTNVSYNNAYATQISCPHGMQTPGICNIAYNSTDLSLQFAQALSASGDAGTGAKTFRMVISKCNIQSDITNTSSNPIVMDIYDIMAKRDFPLLNEVDVANDPVNMWTTGIVDAGGDANAPTVYGQKPFMSGRFTRNFKVKKITTVQLAQGSTHMHRVAICPNQQISNEMLQASDGYFNGLTYVTMIVIRGLPDFVHTGEDGEGFRRPTSGSAQISIVNQRNYQFYAISHAVTINKTESSLPARLTDIEYQLNVGNGDVDVVQNAGNKIL